MYELGLIMGAEKVLSMTTNLKKLLFAVEAMMNSEPGDHDVSMRVLDP